MIDNTKILKKFLKKREYKNETLAQNTKKRYLDSLKAYSELLGISLQELIDEAKEEQLPYLTKTNRFVQPTLEDGKLFDHLQEYIDHQRDKGNAETTISSNVSAIQTFYRTMGVQQIPYFRKKKTITSNKPMTKEELQKGFQINNNSKYEVMWEYMTATGKRVSDVLRTTVEDFMESIEVDTIEELLQMNPNKVGLGYWEFIPQKTRNSTGLVCKVGCTRSSNKKILIYLQDRNQVLPLTLSQPLFLNNRKGKFTNVGLSATTLVVNRKLYEEQVSKYDYQLEHDKISEDKYMKLTGNIKNFHCHGFRQYFITTLANHGVPLRIAYIMEGHVPPLYTDNSYVEIDKKTVLKEYAKVEKYLSLDYNQDTIDREEQIDYMQNRMDKLESILKQYNVTKQGIQ